MNNLSPFCEGSTAHIPENSAATKALNRAVKSISLLAVLNRLDLLDNLVEEIQRWQERNGDE